MSFERIWSEYRLALRKFLLARVSNKADVEDLLQDILLKSHNKIGQLEANDKFKPWLFQIAQNTVIDFYRQKAKERNLDPAALWQQVDEKNIYDELNPCLIPFIHALSLHDTELLMTIDIHNQPQKQYAEQIGISYSTLKSRVQKARQNLKKQFDRCCQFELDKKGNLISYSEKSNSCSSC